MTAMIVRPVLVTFTEWWDRYWLVGIPVLILLMMMFDFLIRRVVIIRHKARVRILSTELPPEARGIPVLVEFVEKKGRVRVLYYDGSRESLSASLGESLDGNLDDNLDESLDGSLDGSLGGSLKNSKAVIGTIVYGGEKLFHFEKE